VPKPLPKITKDDVEKLSHGKPTRSKAGNRSTGHRLTQKERILFESAKRKGFLKIPLTGLRENVENVYRKWCEVTGETAVIIDAKDDK
jgi:hypothetical protein